MLTKPRYSGSITFSDNEQPPVRRGAVLVSGASPHAKVSVIEFDSDDNGQQIDVLRDVKITEDDKSGRLTLTGQSLHAIKQGKRKGLDAVITLRVDVKGCKDCPG